MQRTMLPLAVIVAMCTMAAVPQQLRADRREECAGAILLSTHHKEPMLVAQTHLGQDHVWQLCAYWCPVAGRRAFSVKPAERPAGTGV